jgi:serine/threonine protein kinase
VGDQSTTGDMGSSVSDLVDIGEDFGGESDEIVDLEARYEIESTLGQGGMGEVVLAQDKKLNRQVAIKRLKEELGASRRAARPTIPAGSSARASRCGLLVARVVCFLAWSAWYLFAPVWRWAMTTRSPISAAG